MSAFFDPCARISFEADLVEPPGLPVPLFDTVQRRLASQVEHEQDGHRVIGYEGQHRDKFPLTAEIPYLVEKNGQVGVSRGELETFLEQRICKKRGTHGKGDFGTPDADRLFHEVHSQRLDIILTIRSTG